MSYKHEPLRPDYYAFGSCTGYHRKARVTKCEPLFVAGRGFMVPGVQCVRSENWGRECDSLLYHVIALRGRRKIRMQCFVE